MTQQLSEKNTITIPQAILKQIGVKPPASFKISHNGQFIILTPKDMEDKFTDDEWAKLEKLSKGKGNIYASSKKAKNHLKKLMK